MLLGSAYGKVEIDSSGVKKGADNAVKSLQTLHDKAVKLGASMVDLGKKMTIGVSVPIALLAAQSVKLASDMVETESKVKVVFGNMTDYVQEWSEGSAKSMQLSRQEALEAAATFGNLFVAMKIGREDAAEMSTTLVQLAADLGSINNIDPSIALLKLKSGIVGETEAVRDLGIDLRQTVVEAKAAEMGFKELNGQFAQGDLIAARYAIILEQTQVAQGDIARTGGELAGQMRQLNAQWKDALVALGKNLLPIALKFVTWLNKMLEAFNNLSPAQQKVIGTIVLLVAVIGPLLIILGTLLPMIKMTTASLNPFSGGILGLIFGFVKLVSALAIVVKVLAFFGVSLGPIGAGILGLNAAIAGVGASIFAALLPVLLVLGSLILMAGLFYLAWKTNFLGVRDAAAALVKIVKSLWAAFLAFLRGDTDAALEHLREAFQTFKDHMANYFSGFRRFIDNWKAFLDAVRNGLRITIDYIQKAFTNIDWGKVGKYILLGIANGMLLGIPGLLLMAKKVAEQLLAQIKKSLGISSPSKAAMKLGIFTGQGFAQGVRMGMDPDVIARTIAKPVTNNNSTQQNFTMQFASGLTLKEVRNEIATNNEQIMNFFTTSLQQG